MGNGYGPMFLKWDGSTGRPLVRTGPNENRNGPPLYGTAAQIRGVNPEEDTINYNPNFNYLVFVHQNVERRRDYYQTELVGTSAGGIGTTGAELGWELNKNPDMVKTLTIGPVKVYTLQTEDDAFAEGAGLKFTVAGAETIGTAALRYPIGPSENERGSYERLIGDLTVEAPYVYRDARGNSDPAMPDTYKKVEIKDFRMKVTGDRGAPVIVDNVRYQDPRSGMQQIGFWRTVREDAEYEFRYLPIEAFSTYYALGTLTLDIFDPNEE